MRKFTALVLAFGLFSATSAFAYDKIEWQKMDKNKDGFLNLKEYIGNPEGRNVPALKKQFSRRDANADGKLTLAELNK